MCLLDTEDLQAQAEQLEDSDGYIGVLRNRPFRADAHHHRVLGFLALNNDQAFKAREIARRLDLDEGAVSTALTRLKERDLVEHKGTYWAITTDETRLRSHDGYARATALFNEQLGEEEKGAWKAHAPEESHPSISENTQ